MRARSLFVVLGAGLVVVALMMQRKPLRQLGARGLDLIAGFEGWRDRLYKDIADKWTIGYGHLVRPGERFPAVITKEQGRQILLGDAQNAVRAIVDLVSVPLTQPQFDALVSLVFNIGRTEFSGSTLRKELNAGNYQAAADQFLVWNKAHVGGVLQEVKGLTDRRAAERALFLTPGPWLPQ